MLAAIQARERVARIAHAERVRIAALTAIVQGIWRERRRRRRERPRPDVDACVAYDCRRLERVQADLVPAARNLLVAGALKHWKGRRDAGAPAAALVGIVGKAAEGLEMCVVREATEGDGEGREERKRNDVDGARHDDFELRDLRRWRRHEGGSPFATVRSPHAF